MIIQSHDSLSELMAPQVVGDDSGGTNGADTFIQLLLQDVGKAEQPVTLLASALNLPLFALAFQSHVLGQSAEASASDIPDLDNASETADAEQERQALESILHALQDLFPAMIPILPMLPLTVSTSASGDALVLTPSGAAVASVSGQPDGRGPHTGDLLLAAGGVRQLLLADSRDASMPSVAMPQGAPVVTTPGGELSDISENAMNLARAQTQQTDAHRIATTIASQKAAQEEAVLPAAVRDSQAGAADVSTSDTTGAQPVPRLTPPDTTVLSSEDTSLIPRVRTGSPLRQRAESASAAAVAFGDPGRISGHPDEARVSAGAPAARDMPRPMQLPMVPTMAAPHTFSRSSVLLQLEPPGLGTLLVHVRHMDEKLIASFWTESSEVQSLLRAHFPALHQVLSEQGLSVQQVSLHLATGDGTGEQLSQFSQQQSTAYAFSQGHHGEESSGRRRPPASSPERQEDKRGRVDITV
jgi:hypothetical protein